MVKISGRGFCSGVDLAPQTAEGKVEIEGISLDDFQTTANILFAARVQQSML